MADWSSETNWTIASGSLFDSLTFQSSLSLFDDDDANDEVKELHSNSSPLLLHSPSPDSDSAPCEININFKGKHELRQIYVRSTARVYEIYYAPNHRSNNEYLCTVRCGAAVRDGQVLRVQETDSSQHKDIKNEDDWVEVRLPNSNNTSQELFEATAEIDDATPCISVTLRLLSLHSKGCVYVDEIYVFADPVDSPDSESLETRNENSSATSLIAMFLPSLMQLSKTTGLSSLNAVTKEKQFVSQDDLVETHPGDSVIKTQPEGKAGMTSPQEVKLKEVNGPSQPDTPSQFAKMESHHTAVPSQAAKMESNHSAVPSQVATTESNRGDSLGGNVERALEQLISRMDRIEEICLGFQEKMVMPISSVEARLQRVELQLDTLTKKLQNSGSPSCCRISAPDASCLDSDANSGDNCFGYTATTVIESDAKDLRIHVLDVSSDDISDSASTPQLLPGLVVKAPEFPDGEDEEDNASGQEMSSSTDKGKLSIDDALSSALANFLSSSSPRYTKSLTVKAPEFSNEDSDDPEIESSDESAKNASVHLTESEKINHIQVLTSSDISLQSEEEVNRDSNDKHCVETAQEAEEYAQFCGKGDQTEVGVKASIIAEHDRRTGFNNNLEDENGSINGKKSDGWSSNRCDISNELLDNRSTSGSGIAQEGLSTRTVLKVATEVPKKASHEDIIENVLGFSLASCVVNFEIPLLDVKFISQTCPVTEPFLEALLYDTPETNSRDPYPSVKESSDDDLSIKEQLKNNGDLSVEEQSNLVSIDDGELVDPASDSHFAVDNDYCSSISVPVNIGGDNLPEDQKRKRDEISIDSTSSLI